MFVPGNSRENYVHHMNGSTIQTPLHDTHSTTQDILLQHPPSKKGLGGSAMRYSCTDSSQSKMHMTRMLLSSTVNWVLSGEERKCISICRPCGVDPDPVWGCRMLVNTLGLAFTGSSVTTISQSLGIKPSNTEYQSCKSFRTLRVDPVRELQWSS